MPQGNSRIFEFLLLLRRATESERRAQRRAAFPEATDALFHRLQTGRRLRRPRRISGRGFHHRPSDLGRADSFPVSADPGGAWIFGRLAGYPASASADTGGRVGATRRAERAIRARTRLCPDRIKVEVFGNYREARARHASAVNRALCLSLCAKKIRAGRHILPGQPISTPPPARLM